jgi:hypothetical protein
MKLLLLPTRIWLFGYHDGLSIDCKMKHVYAVIGKLGGSGGNAEEAAIKGILRSIALWPVVRDLRQRKHEKQWVVTFECSPNITFAQPILFANVNRLVYIQILRYMFGGEIGKEVDAAFRKFGSAVKVNGFDLDHLQFYSKLMQNDSSPHKYIGTYEYDWSNSRRCLRNNASKPRRSSTVIATFASGRKVAMEVQVRNISLH